ncbi:Protein E [Trema orientale]|uniref:Protein E n=1 Tax=Trema orientale TaxID=63057 RepID=A0A2P5FJ43_TREOI|nr:Protein E [Trema orientale]
MASSSIPVFFFVLLLFSAFQVKARESKLFSKVTHNNAIQPSSPKKETPVEVLTPAPAPETAVPAPSPAPSSGTNERENGYGLYGQEEAYNERFPSTKEIPTTSGGVENELLSEDFPGNEGFEINDDENEAERRDRGLDKRKYYSGPVTKNYYYGNNGYDQIKPIERQGMSDTRFLDNGRYFRDVKNENENENNYNKNYRYYNNGYDQTAERNTRYEFDSMEEYEKYQESQGYVP